jgi:hypothetical protein
MDRIMLRPSYKSPTKEPPHRDASPEKVAGSSNFGGWLNVDLKSQFFRCAPGTHTLLHDGRAASGFRKLAPDEVAALAKLMETVEVPSGAIIVFHNSLAHEVRPSVDVAVRRLFLGWRLTPGTLPLFDDTAAVLANQGVPRLPSGQRPRLWPEIAWVFHRDALVDWSRKTLVPAAIGKRTLEKTGEQLTVAREFCPSLADMKLPLYPTYAPHEAAILHPASSFTLPRPLADGSLSADTTLFEIRPIAPIAPPTSPKRRAEGQPVERPAKRQRR